MSSVTIVVPTYNESGNVPELVRRLDAVREQASIDEVIFVDDSTDDTPAISPLQLKTKCKRWIMQNGLLDLVIVDYLQLMVSGQNKENRVQEVGYVSRTLKALAKELKVPILAAAQLSRAVEQREDKRPQLSDLRESGDIEADADVVMFLWDPNSNKEDEIAYPTLLVEKHRNGPVGEVPLRFYKKTASFENSNVKK